MYPAETLALAAMMFVAFPVVGGLLAGVLFRNQRWIRQSATVLMRTVHAAAFAGKVANWQLALPSRESHIRPLLARLEGRRPHRGVAAI
jgi:hypothetical protein